MNTDNKPFREWFGYSRRERRSTLFLIIILIIVVALRYLLPPKDIDIENLSELLVTEEKGEINFKKTAADTTKLFLFDPNSATFDTLTRLGFTDKQARTVISYRNKGGKFRKSSDISRVYGIDEQTASKFIPFIKIRRDTFVTRQLKAGSTSVQKKRVPLNLNSADSAALENLPGLGPVLSSRIIKYRKLLGGFVSPEQLKEVYGLSEETFNLLTGRIYADSSMIIGIEINDSGFKELSKHPYLKRYDIQAILKYRELKGHISGTNELVENKIITAGTAKKISPYLIY
jgi:competence protein ComEA